MPKTGRKNDMLERRIRDYLARHLDVLQPDLEFVATEYEVEPTSGTEASIDILATLERKYVIIEVKRSDQSARATTNEISKYAQGLKRKLHLNDDEIQVFVVSTTWRELTIPFAYMASRLGIPCRGFLIEWEDSVKKCSKCSEIVIPQLIGARLFSPRHGFYYYHTADDVDKGLKSHEEVFFGRGLADFVVVKLRAPEGLHERLAAEYRVVAASLELSPSIFDGNDEKFDYVLYTAFIRRDEDAYRAMLSRDPNVLEEAECQLNDNMTEDERLLVFERATLDLEPFPYSNYIETGYPEKFAGALLRDQGWKIEKVYRYGSVAENRILSDEDIVSEIAGNQGVNKGRVKSSAKVSNSAELSRLRSEVVRCLSDDNAAWREQLLFVLQKIGSDPTLQECSVQLDLMSPNNFLIGLFHEITDAESGYLPSYRLVVRNSSGQVVRMFRGLLAWSGKPPDFSAIVERYFGGDVFRLVMTLNWGGFLKEDEHIIAELGISYETFALQLAVDGSIAAVSVLENFRFVDGAEAFSSLKRFVAENQTFILDLVNGVAQYLNRGFVFGPSDEDVEAGEES